jgi:hypothetical protein
MRHPEGKNTLTTASPISASHPRAPSRRAPAKPLDELSCPTHAKLYTSLSFN